MVSSEQKTVSIVFHAELTAPVWTGIRGEGRRLSGMSQSRSPLRSEQAATTACSGYAPTVMKAKEASCSLGLPSRL
jgi:hypothetical protein